MDSQGFLAIPIPIDPETDKQIDAVIPCGAAVLLSNLEEAIQKNHSAIRTDEKSMEVLHAVRTLLIQKASEADSFVFNDKDDWAREFSSFTPDQVKYTWDLVAYIRQHNSRNAQGPQQYCWLANGFGFFSKVAPGFQVPILDAASREFTKKGLSCRVDGAGSLICPPRKDNNVLKSHADGPIYPEAVRILEEFLASGGRTNSEYCAKHRTQSLIHLRGGRMGSGATCTLSPMTPARMLLLMKLIGESEEGSKFVADRNGGPKFYKPSPSILRGLRDRLLSIRKSPGEDLLEQILAEETLDPEVRWVRMEPEGIPGPFALAFPLGYFHLKIANRDEGRISLAGGLSFTPPQSKKRSLDFLHDQTLMATDERAVKRVRGVDKRSSNGPVHRDPGFAAELLAPGRPMAPLCFTPQQFQGLQDIMR